MSTILTVTAPAFRGLKNPYTGEPMQVKMLVPKNGAPLFFAPDTYSTKNRFPTRAEMVAAWNRVDGISGRKDGQPFRCAYTGEPLRPTSNGSEAWFEGGFDPTIFHRREEFLYYATMRDGKAVRPVPRPLPPAQVQREAPPPETSAAPDISADAQREAEKIVDELPGSFEKKPFVSMAQRRQHERTAAKRRK